MPSVSYASRHRREAPAVPQGVVAALPHCRKTREASATIERGCSRVPFSSAMLVVNGREATAIFLRRFVLSPRHAAATSRRLVKTGEEKWKDGKQILRLLLAVASRKGRRGRED
nr:hypothetical protein Iba_chr06aCG11360 [Ipomoea batatas]